MDPIKYLLNFLDNNIDFVLQLSETLPLMKCTFLPYNHFYEEVFQFIFCGWV